MITLGISTGTEVSEVALVRDGETLSSRRTPDIQNHLVWLAPSIHEMLSACALTPADIDLIACLTGPGSFTGVRLGITTAKTMSQVLGKPVVPVNTLDALAAAAADAPEAQHNKETLIIPCMDARKRQVFLCEYIARADAPLERSGEYRAADVDDFFSFLGKLDGTVILAGTALVKYGGAISRNAPGAVLLDEDFWHPRADVVARIGSSRFNPRTPLDYKILTPLYLRAADIREPKKQMVFLAPSAQNSDPVEKT